MEKNTLGNTEYILWGIAPNTIEEQILLTKFKGNSITDKSKIIELKSLLENRHKCTNVRIQEIDLLNGFTKNFINSL